MNEAEQMEPYEQEIGEVLQNFQATEKGLTSEEAAKRQEKYGANALARAEK